MEANNWIIGQLIIDIIMAALLLYFLRSHLKSKGTYVDPETTFKRSETILAEMREISQGLEKNLAEKKELSRNILGQLDAGLKKAEESYQQIQGIIKEFSGNQIGRHDSLRDPEKTRSSVNALLAKGLSKKEISQHLGLSIGEIELLLKLVSRPDSSDLE